MMNDKPQSRDDDKLSGLFRQRDSTVSVNLDPLQEEDRAAILEAMATKTNFTEYKGEVEYGYDVKYTMGHSVCPRCNSDLQRHYGHFAYATETASRVMFAPAGYFCTACPTVVIDQDILREGVADDYTYQGILGVHGVEGERRGLFKTWNDKKVVYIVDGQRMTMSFKETIDKAGQKKDVARNSMKKRNKNRKKLEKLAKRKNRAKR